MDVIPTIPYFPFPLPWMQGIAKQSTHRAASEAELRTEPLIFESVELPNLDARHVSDPEHPAPSLDHGSPC
jgi:hypothetical protein